MSPGARQAPAQDNSVELRIGRVVWHGSGAPDARALSAAIESALGRALSQQQAPHGAPLLERTAASIVQQLMPTLRGITRR